MIESEDEEEEDPEDGEENDNASEDVEETVVYDLTESAGEEDVG